MKAIKIISAVTFAVFLLFCIPANGFNLKNPLDAIGIPNPILDQLGSLMYTTKVKACDPCERDDEVQLAKAVWDKLLQAAPTTPPYKAAKVKKWQWDLTLIEDMGISDAEAFPGGKVIVYSRASAIAQKKPAQIAFLLGHEMAHALARHAKTRIDKHTKTAVMSAVAGGSLDATKLDPKVTLAVMTAMGVAYEGATAIPFAKEQESEADRNALLIMAKAGYDPQSAVDYLIALKKDSAKAKHSFLDDHPPVADRIADLKANMATAMNLYQSTRG